MRKIAEIIKQHLEDPNISWESDEHTLDNKTYGYSLWIANMRMKNLDIYRPLKITLTEKEREVLNPLIDTALENQFLKLIESKNK